jgi:membrane-associated protein
VGYVGGATFEHDPLKGLLLGFGLAAAVTVAVELARHGVRRRRARWCSSPPAADRRAAAGYGRLPCGNPGPLR